MVWRGGGGGGCGGRAVEVEVLPGEAGEGSNESCQEEEEPMQTPPPGLQVCNMDQDVLVYDLTVPE